MNTIRLNTIGTPCKAGGNSGGGGGGSVSTMEYFNLKQFDEDTRYYLLVSSCLIAASGGVIPSIISLELIDIDTLLSLAEAVAIMPNLVIVDNYFKGTIREKLIKLEVDYDSLPRITEEEFYTL